MPWCLQFTFVSDPEYKTNVCDHHQSINHLSPYTGTRRKTRTPREQRTTRKEGKAIVHHHFFNTLCLPARTISSFVLWHSSGSRGVLNYLICATFVVVYLG